MTGTTKVCMAEADNGIVVVLVSRAVGIYVGVVSTIHRIRNRIRLRAQLHHPEGHGGTGVAMTHALGADERVDVGCEVGLRKRIYPEE